MAYEADALIPLQNLNESASRSSDDDNFSDSSATSEFFDDIDRYRSHSDQKQDFLSDANFIEKLLSFQGSKTLSKKVCGAILASIFLIWTVALVLYSTGNVQRKASAIWHGPNTNIVLLSHRNISLNDFLLKKYNVSFENYRKGAFVSPRKMVRWLVHSQFPQSDSSYGNGFYLTQHDEEYVVHQFGTKYSYKILESRQFEYENSFFQVEEFHLNPGLPIDDESTFHILVSDETYQWRHSKFSIYWLWQQSTGKVFPLQPTGIEKDSMAIEKLHFAKFDPSGKYVVFGHNHDLFLYELLSGETTRVTVNGNSNVFNGKPDYVYEEEVIAGDNMVWWCPDLSNFVFATLNDTKVEEYHIDYFSKDPEEIAMSYDQPLAQKSSEVNQYPIRTSIKYPKPGTPIPEVSLTMFNLSLRKQTVIDIQGVDTGDDPILYDVNWIDADNLLLKVSDRTSTILSKKLFKPLDSKVMNISLTNTSTFGGWIEKASPIALVSRNDKTGYLDKVVSDNKVQLAFFDLASSQNYSKILGPVYYNSPLAYDAIEGVVYGLFGTDFNHTFSSVSIEDASLKVLQENGKFMPIFSPDGQFVDLEYAGPLLPWQKLMNMADLHAGAVFENVGPFNDQSNLKKVLESTNIPTRVYSKVKVGMGDEAVELNMMEILPPNFDLNKKHPLLVHTYGGPGAAIVDYSFRVEFQDIVSSQLDAVVLIIDPRGTNPDNWKLKSCAREKLGFWEPRDIVTVTKDYIKTNKYVDESKTALWGWSYGGYTTLKTLEFDKGDVFKFGAAVAPVTNWMFYDAIYTERYMKKVEDNPNYVAISRINGFSNFKKVKRFMIMHGSADDNVHLQNTMWLLDKFDVNEVENYDIHIFPDNDHSIFYHNSNSMVYDKLLWWLQQAFLGFYD